MSAMNRRKILGLFGGAAAAGPAVAAKFASDITSPAASMPSAIGGLSAGIAAKDDDGSWKLSRIADLKRMLSVTGPTDDEKRQKRISLLYAAETEERHRLDSLRSISGSRKAKMLAASAEERQRRIQRMYYENELDQLLSQLNPFNR